MDERAVTQTLQQDRYLEAERRRLIPDVVEQWGDMPDAAAARAMYLEDQAQANLAANRVERNLAANPVERHYANPNPEEVERRNEQEFPQVPLSPDDLRQIERVASAADQAAAWAADFLEQADTTPQGQQQATVQRAANVAAAAQQAEDTLRAQIVEQWGDMPDAEYRREYSFAMPTPPEAGSASPERFRARRPFRRYPRSALRTPPDSSSADTAPPRARDEDATLDYPYYE